MRITNFAKELHTRTQPTVAPGDVISYLEMCQLEGTSLQRGMNFHLDGRISVILMSLRRGAPYADRVEDNGRVLIYEGHDISRMKGGPDPKDVDQPESFPSGRPTQNGLFFNAAMRTSRGESPPELVRVYEKIHVAFGCLTAFSDCWRLGQNRLLAVRNLSSNFV